MWKMAVWMCLWVPLAAMAAVQDDDKAADEALDKFKAEYKGVASDRASAVNNLGQVQHKKTLSKLLNVLMGDPEAPVRIAAAQAIGGWKEDKTRAAAMLQAALQANARVPEVAAEIYKAMGALEDPVVLPGVHRAFKEKDTKIAKAAIECTGEIRSRDSIDPIIDYMKDMERRKGGGGLNTGVPGGGGMGGFNLPGGGGGGSDPQAQRAKELHEALVAAIQAITLERYAAVNEWEIWWDRNKATFKVPPKPAKPAKKKK